MAITAGWESTDTNVRGAQTEVILPLRGLEEVHPAEDRVITQTLRGELSSIDGQEPLWEKLKLDREECRLHIFVNQAPDVPAIKQVVDRALRKASEVISENMQQRESDEEQARAEAELRQRRAVSLRDSFRDHEPRG
jgi:hypothetical protein